MVREARRFAGIVALGALACLASVAFARPPCTIEGAPSQVVLDQTAHFTVVAAPTDTIRIDLSKGYPPPAGAAATYHVYPSNFHPAGSGGAETPLTVQVCPFGVSPNTGWNLQISIDDMVDPTTKARIPAGEIYVRRSVVGTWTQGSPTPTVLLTEFGGATRSVRLYFEARLQGSEAAGSYQADVHFNVLATP